MKEISEYLKQNSIRALSYKTSGNVTILDTNVGKVVIKKNNKKKEVFDYLDSRNFDHYPKILVDDNYIVYRYEEDSNMPKEQKITDLVNLISLLHNKTAYYKEVSIDDYKRIFEELYNNLQYLDTYYNKIIQIIDSKVFYSPSEFLLSRNISFIFNAINKCKEDLKSWYDSVKDLTSMKVSVVHNDLKLSHYIKNEKDYLISWDKAKIDMSVYDLYSLYNNNFFDLDFIELLNLYKKKHPLKKYELDLLFILLLMPLKIDFNDTEFNKCKKISDEIYRICKNKNIISKLVSP